MSPGIVFAFAPIVTNCVNVAPIVNLSSHLAFLFRRATVFPFIIPCRGVAPIVFCVFMFSAGITVSTFSLNWSGLIVIGVQASPSDEIFVGSAVIFSARYDLCSDGRSVDVVFVTSVSIFAGEVFKVDFRLRGICIFHKMDRIVEFLLSCFLVPHASQLLPDRLLAICSLYFHDVSKAGGI